MKKVVLISCVSKKKQGSFKAKEIYISDLFIKSYFFAKKYFKDSKIFILSAKYGLVEENEIIESYDLTLKNFSVSEKKEWSKKVFNSLKNKIDADTEVVFLAGNSYSYFLKKLMKNPISEPLKGLKFGERLSYLKKHNEANPGLF